MSDIVARVSDQLFASEFRSHPTNDPVAEPRYHLGHFIYLAAIAIATIGWLWLLARVALSLVQSIL